MFLILFLIALAVLVPIAAVVWLAVCEAMEEGDDIRRSERMK